MASDKANAPPSRAQANFKASEQRDHLVRQEMEKERAATDAKTIRLKALRLAKEAADKAEAAANPPPPKPVKRRKPA
jgi:hypothetical protein